MLHFQEKQRFFLPYHLLKFQIFRNLNHLSGSVSARVIHRAAPLQAEYTWLSGPVSRYR